MSSASSSASPTTAQQATTPSTENKGHVFILHTDLRHVNCDAWVVPASKNLSLGPSWLEPQIHKLHLANSNPPTEFQRFFTLLNQHCPIALTPFLVSGWPQWLPLPWVFPIPSDRSELPTLTYQFIRSCTEHFAGTVDHSLYARWRQEVLPCMSEDDRSLLARLRVSPSFFSKPKHPAVEAARATDLLSTGEVELQAVPPRHRRERHLIAMPVISTGFGGNRDSSGAVIRALLPQLYAAANDFNVDIALVTNEGHMHKALQAERLRFRSAPWPDLPPPLLAQARMLADEALKSRLVVFIGAGSSLSCGLLSWWGLLQRLAMDAPNPPTPEQLEGLLSCTDPLAQGQALLPFYNDDVLALKQATGKLCTSPCFGLQHALLASIDGLANVVTTNYDDNFERAAKGANRRCARLPYEPPTDADLWLLKMHGCIRRPEDIVITASDYSTYGERRAALAGIVQSLLITKHMLFVGFSLTDPNFETIIGTVRRAVEAYQTPTQSASPSSPSVSQPFLGTSIQLAHRTDLATAYQDIQFAWMAAERIDAAARQAEIFLDCLAAHSSDHLAFLNAPMYSSLLAPEETEIQQSIRHLTHVLSSEAKDTRAYRVLIAGLIKMFGQFDESVLDEEFSAVRIRAWKECLTQSGDR